jgi:hypothetical protein
MLWSFIVERSIFDRRLALVLFERKIIHAAIVSTKNVGR